MKLVLLGAPGAGKGTQATKIATDHNIPHISTGDIFRKNLKELTPIGIKAKEYISKGQLVPDDVTVEIVRLRLQEDDCKNGFLLDGFPRNINQAKELDAITSLDGVIDLAVDLNALADRLSGRRVCKACGESYHITMNQDDVCKCGGEIYQRDDDKPETVKARLEVYSKETAPLTEYYKEKGKLLTVDGMQTIEKVSADIEAVLKSL